MFDLHHNERKMEGEVSKPEELGPGFVFFMRQEICLAVEKVGRMEAEPCNVGFKF